MSTADKLRSLGFVHLMGGKVRLGSNNLTPCTFEGGRKNEGPIRETEVGPFWIARYTITNTEYQRYGPQFIPSFYSEGPNHPVTNVTYVNAIGYAEWLSKKEGVEFTLPTEPQWCFAAAPYGWEYTTGKNKPKPSQVKVWKKSEIGAVEVNDPRYPPNWAGLFHMGGNIWEYTLGARYIPGTWGAETDGMVVVVKGGGFFHCTMSTSPRARGVVDIAIRCPELGFRLVCNEATNIKDTSEN